MKKKSFLFVFVIIFCFILSGCTKEESRHRNILQIVLDAPDGSSLYPYGPTPPDGIYVLQEAKTYNLFLDFTIPWATVPDNIVMEYDESIFEVICLMTPEDPAYGYTTLPYQLTCLKKCESTSFSIYPLCGHPNNDDPCRRDFIFRVE